MKISKSKIIDLYVNKKHTLRQIAELFNTNHHLIKRILLNNNIEITRKDRIRKPFTEEHKRKISISSKGRKGCWLGKKMPKITIYKNMVTHLKYDIELDWLIKFEDIDRLKILNKALTRERDKIGINSEIYKNFIEKFYYDKKFNLIYNNWIKNNKDKYLKPSLDHINPKSKGCEINDINNLQFLTWFENRCKNDMNIDEWNKIKNNISKYFI